ncbi:hypothetical protein C8R47DRAFT_1326523 [Mycena vitilis]|nr:hypothetical protein C8R47DRAFT_1326523 [Mycena vitilis]
MIPCPECGSTAADGSLTAEIEALVNAVVPGTRHYTLLNNNQPPDDSEISFIRLAISSTDAPLTRLDEEISKLQKTLKRLEEERALLSSHRTRNIAILSPLRRMPPEVLSEIFLWAVPSTTDALRCTKFDMDASPWVLLRTSSRWRAIALYTPSLWTRIAVDYSLHHDASFAYPLPLAKAQIARSQTRKLKVHFYAHPGAEAEPQVQLFEFLAQHSSRWEELSIGLTSAIVSLLPALQNRVPSLERLWIQWDGDSESQTIESIDCFQTAPSLVDAGVLNEFSLVSTVFPVHQLTRYQLDGPWATHKEILKLASNLIEAHIEISFDEDSWPEPNGTIDLRHVRRLYVSDIEVLAFLHVPLLEDIALMFEDGGPNPTPLVSFLNRSRCPLRRLTVKGHPDAHITSDILRRITCITELVILSTEVTATNALISTLTASNLGRSTTIAPQLRLIFLGCNADCYMDEKLYLEMLESRWKAEDCALKSAALIVDFGPRPDTTMVEIFSALREDGLDLFLLSGAEAGEKLDWLGHAASWN